jgi:photosystem II stability/assembly factor-like uncharacterized protein
MIFGSLSVVLLLGSQLASQLPVADVGQVLTPLTAPEGTFERVPLRGVGPANMGGRVVDLAVDAKKPARFYLATATGGVWRTENGGTTWSSLGDRFALASVGAVACAEDRFDTVWVGGGEANPRNSVSRGSGVYGSTDGGKTWKGPFLEKSGHVGRIVIHPKNPLIVYVAVLGKIWGPSAERGVYRTSDGGASWKQVLALDEDTGCVDLALDPGNPARLIACGWQARRDQFSQGNPTTQFGKKSGLYLSENNGDSWRQLMDGLPSVAMGRAGVSFCGKDSKTVYAVISTEMTDIKQLIGQPAAAGGDPQTGGVFKSTDGGLSWRKVNKLCPRPFYFGQVRVDPSNAQRVWVLGIPLYVSQDGGKTFKSNGAPLTHVDHHALWIDPADGDHLLLGNDGGLYETRDRGQNWEHRNNLALAQFYGVAVDRSSPYRVFGGLQDNGTWGGGTRHGRGEALGTADWFRVMGSDGFQAKVDREDNNILYCESQYGGLRRYDLSTGEGKEIKPGGSLRFNWNAPLALSPHDARVIYYGSQQVHRSGDRGNSWARISADLTFAKGDTNGQQHTLTALAESPTQAGVIWTGSDDGRLCLTRDGGRSWVDWTNRLPKLENSSVTCIEPVRGLAGSAYVAYSRHRLEDHEPYLFRTDNFGESWRKVGELPAGAPVHVVREDPANAAVLYVGTETGVLVSLDAGLSWERLGKLPTVPVYDLAIQESYRELVIGTHGRGIFILDISALGVMKKEVLGQEAWLYGPGKIEQGAAFGPNLLKTGQFFQAPNREPSAVFSAHLKKKPGSKAKVTVRDSMGRTLVDLKLEPQAGFQVVRWNLTALQSLTSGKRTLRVGPGNYVAGLVVDEREVMAVAFVVSGRTPMGTNFDDEETAIDMSDADERSKAPMGGPGGKESEQP